MLTDTNTLPLHAVHLWAHRDRLGDGADWPAIAQALEGTAQLPLPDRWSVFGMIEELLRVAPDPVRALAVRCLAGAAGVEVWPLLTEALASPDAAVRHAAVEAFLVSVGNDPDRIVHLLTHADAEVRREAMRCLPFRLRAEMRHAFLGDTEVREEALAQLWLDAFNPKEIVLLVRACAAGTLSADEGRRAIASLDPSIDLIAMLLELTPTFAPQRSREHLDPKSLRARLRSELGAEAKLVGFVSLIWPLLTAPVSPWRDALLSTAVTPEWAGRVVNVAEVIAQQCLVHDQWTPPLLALAAVACPLLLVDDEIPLAVRQAALPLLPPAPRALLADWSAALAHPGMATLLGEHPLRALAMLGVPGAPWWLAPTADEPWRALVVEALRRDADGAMALTAAARHWPQVDQAELGAMVAEAWRPALLAAWFELTKRQPITGMAISDMLPDDLRGPLSDALLNASPEAMAPMSRRELEVLAQEFANRLLLVDVVPVARRTGWASGASIPPFHTEVHLALAGALHNNERLRAASTDLTASNAALDVAIAERSRRRNEEVLEITAEEEHRLLTAPAEQVRDVLVATYAGRATLGVVPALLRRQVAREWEGSERIAILFLFAHDDFVRLERAAEPTIVPGMTVMLRREALVPMAEVRRWTPLGEAVRHEHESRGHGPATDRMHRPRTPAAFAERLLLALGLASERIAGILISHLVRVYDEADEQGRETFRGDPAVQAATRAAVAWAITGRWEGPGRAPARDLEWDLTASLIGDSAVASVIALGMRVLPEQTRWLASRWSWAVAMKCIAEERRGPGWIARLRESVDALRPPRPEVPDDLTVAERWEQGLDSTDREAVRSALFALGVLRAPLDEIVRSRAVEGSFPPHFDLFARIGYGRKLLTGPLAVAAWHRVADPTLPAAPRFFLGLLLGRADGAEATLCELFATLTAEGGPLELQEDDLLAALWAPELLAAMLRHAVAHGSDASCQAAITVAGHLGATKQVPLLRQLLERTGLQRETAEKAARTLLTECGDAAGLPLILSFADGNDYARAQALSKVPGAELRRVLRSALLAGPKVLDEMFFEPGEWTNDSVLESLRSWLVWAIEARTDDPPLVNESLLTLATTPTGDSCRSAAVAALHSRAYRHPQTVPLAESLLWGEGVARRLIGRDIQVQLLSGEDLGHTRPGGASISVNPLPLLRGERGGAAVLRGLIVHELGHHRYHATPEFLAMIEQSHLRELGALFNLVLDEHLERNLRSEDPELGNDLHVLVAYAFRHARREIPIGRVVDALGHTMPQLIGMPLVPGVAPGHVRLSARQIMAIIERAGGRFGRFMRALRMGLGARDGDPVIAEALQCFGKGFRHLDADGLWQVTERLAAIFGDEVRQATLLDLGWIAIPTAAELHGSGLDARDVEEGRRARLGAPPLAAKRRSGPRVVRANRSNTTTYPPITIVLPVAHDPAPHAALAAQVRGATSELRALLLSLGFDTAVRGGRLQGLSVDHRRLGRALATGDPRMLADRRRRVDPDLYLGLAIDCSGSMEGSKMERARLAGTLLAEACRGLPGVELGIIGFTDDTIFLAGNADQCAVHALEAGGGNNDAAALAHAAAAARESRRRSKLLLMISDGFPTECSVKSLEHLVASLTKEGIRCAQVAVGPLETVSFPHHVVFTASDPGVAIPAFGRAVANLVSQTLRSTS